MNILKKKNASLLIIISLFLAACDEQFPQREVDNPNIVNGVDTTIIRTDFPFESRFLAINGSEMHYVDEGQGDITYLLLHGQPTSVYLWRNIILHLRQQGRVVAPDLIGFGKSDKPDIDYSFADHQEYIKQFIDQLELRNIVLVVHDWGSGLGFDYAAKYPDNIRGLVFFEAMLDPVASFEGAPGGSDFFRTLRTGVEGDTTVGSSWDLVVRQNLIMDQLLPNFIFRPIQPTELMAYQAPFLQEEDRKPIWRFFQELPVAGQPASVHAAQVAYNIYLQSTPVPKLYLYATPGVINREVDQLPYVQQNFPNTKTVFLGRGLHFLQETHPHKIGINILEWAKESF